MNNPNSEKYGKLRAVPGYANGEIPLAAFNAASGELVGMQFGKVRLEFYVQHGKIVRFTTGREQSFLPDTEMSNDE